MILHLYYYIDVGSIIITDSVAESWEILKQRNDESCISCMSFVICFVLINTDNSAYCLKNDAISREFVTIKVTTSD